MVIGPAAFAACGNTAKTKIETATVNCSRFIVRLLICGFWIWSRFYSCIQFSAHNCLWHLLKTGSCRGLNLSWIHVLALTRSRSLRTSRCKFYENQAITLLECRVPWKNLSDLTKE